jgi:hypothetical protein
MVLREARENVSYLDKQLEIVADPLLREKLQGLIANEIEKEMLVSKEAFRVVDPAFRLKDYKIKKVFPILLSICFSFLTILTVIFLHAVSNVPKSQKDFELIKKIKNKIWI